MPFHNDSPYGDGAWGPASADSIKAISEKQQAHRAARAWQPTDRDGWCALLTRLGVDHRIAAPCRLPGDYLASASQEPRIVIGSDDHWLVIEPGLVHTNAREGGPKGGWVQRRRGAIRMPANREITTTTDLAAALALVGVSVDPAAI